jgi:hypothetical protein
MRGSEGSRRAEVVTGSWRSLTGGRTWRCQLADQVGGLACGGPASSRDPSASFDAKIGRLPAARCGHRQLALSGWRSLTGRATWRCQLAERLGGPVWRTSLAVSPVVRRVEPKLISTLRSENRQVSDGARWFPTVGALWLALFDWRRTLAVSVGGAGWRCCLWRCGFEPRLISEIRCEDRKVPGGESWSPAVGALWLALSDWRSNLAVSVGGATWRTGLADLVGGVARGGPV